MTYTKSQYAWIGLRLSLGWIFFWAFIDKLFGLGFATKPAGAWLAGGSPTTGFLSNAVTGPFASIYKAMSGSVVIDVLFMAALLVIGVTLLTGAALKFGSYIGALLVFLMWTALLFPANNPVVDDHIVYLFVFLVFASKPEVGKWCGLADKWAKTKIAKKYALLR
ncbi:MAG TPA: hypothetical protein VJI12_03380 [archaeon]|nr:hypothetical protein [archaeon]